MLEEKTRETPWSGFNAGGCPQRESGKLKIIRIPKRRFFITSSIIRVNRLLHDTQNDLPGHFPFSIKIPSPLRASKR
jgi:hypothetical protein